MDDKELVIEAVGTSEVRKGVYSNMVTITSLQLEDVIDFFFIDGSSDSGAMTGSIVARIIMSRTALIALRDAIDTQLNKVSGENNADKG